MPGSVGIRMADEDIVDSHPGVKLIPTLRARAGFAIAHFAHGDEVPHQYLNQSPALQGNQAAEFEPTSGHVKNADGA